MKLIILKKAETEDLYDEYKEILEAEIVAEVQNLLGIGAWERVKLDIRPPDYQLYFQPTRGGEAKPVLYDIWFTNGFAEIYIRGSNSYKKLSQEDSEKLNAIISVI